MLVPLMKKAREADVRAVLMRDKLIIGGVPYLGGSIDEAIREAKLRKEKDKSSENENKNRGRGPNINSSSGGADGGPEDAMLTS